MRGCFGRLFVICVLCLARNIAGKKYIALLGGTGGVGRKFIDLALDRGHYVKALVRTPSKLSNIEDSNLEIVKGDSTCLDDVKRVVRGTDVLVSCVGNKGSELVMEKTAGNIVQAKPRRSIVLSSLGLGGTSNALKSVFYMLVGKKAVEDYENADEILRNSKTPSVTVVRPTGLSNASARKKYDATNETSFRFTRRIPRADVALFLADMLENTEWDGKCVQLY
uniref:NAD(P)-binding domain-containing protein n=1 Tax=Leptocylindrus danicus TaxID=163516 RepID=A0A7S2K8N6_9STRA|mmetsp:Transcript_19851/g.29506  ORF Transcript_19851/g.29506 Transcript_19851/m.29506 type:complete len:223 (+) Transcript_19851:58-726(+)